MRLLSFRCIEWKLFEATVAEMLHSPSLNPIAAPLSRWQMAPISKSKIGTAWQS
jgi:hypothetical protein